MAFGHIARVIPRTQLITTTAHFYVLSNQRNPLQPVDYQGRGITGQVQSSTPVGHHTPEASECSI
jgi:hypothetical protein